MSLPATPVLILDVDGVLNIDLSPWDTPCGTGRVVSSCGISYRMRWAPEAAQQLTDLHRSGTVEIRWATTWIDHNPTQIESLLSLPALTPAFPSDLARIYADDYRAQYRAAKLAAALAVVQVEGRPLIWVDDDAIPAGGPERDVLDGAGSLLIRPYEMCGLTPEHLDQIRAYAARTSAPTSTHT
jgi:hypothetical protein